MPGFTLIGIYAIILISPYETARHAHGEQWEHRASAVYEKYYDQDTNKTHWRLVHSAPGNLIEFNRPCSEQECRAMFIHRDGAIEDVVVGSALLASRAAWKVQFVETITNKLAGTFDLLDGDKERLMKFMNSIDTYSEPRSSSSAPQ